MEDKGKLTCFRIQNLSNTRTYMQLCYVTSRTTLLHQTTKHENQRSSQRKCREHLSNLPSQCDNATHQGISISQPCYEEECMECREVHWFWMQCNKIACQFQYLTNFALYLQQQWMNKNIHSHFSFIQMTAIPGK